MDASGFLADQFHENCNSFLCEIECISSLNMHLKLYLTELSRVFFKKANIRNKHPWWLSTFYSFCIQSIVRKALMRLTTASDRGATNGMHLPAKHYLYLPVRLFIASSAAYDIQNLYLEGKSKPGGEGIPSAEDYREARRAVGQTAWASNGISGCFDYLKKLFEDDGVALQPNKLQWNPVGMETIESSTSLPSEASPGEELPAATSLIDLSKRGSSLSEDSTQWANPSRPLKRRQMSSYFGPRFRDRT